MKDKDLKSTEQMDLNKKRDEAVERAGYVGRRGKVSMLAEHFEGGFDACAEILSAEIKELENALEFYANKENWLESKSHKGFFEVMQEQDCEVFDESKICGKLARQVLSKLRGGK